MAAQHAPQFWGVSRCLGMAIAHAKERSFEYRYALRVRPDGAFDENITAALGSVVQDEEGGGRGGGGGDRGGAGGGGATKSGGGGNIDSHVKGRAWLRGDSFAVLSRGAIGAYAAIYSRFLDDNCATLPKVPGCGKATRDSVFGPGVRKMEDSTECLIVKHLVSEHVKVSRCSWWEYLGSFVWVSCLRRRFKLDVHIRLAYAPTCVQTA